MSSPTPIYSASVSPDFLKYMLAYATGNDGCIKSITALFQPSDQVISAQYLSGSSNVNAGFFYQPTGTGVNIFFFSTTVPQDTFTIILTANTTQGNTYQLASISTLPPDPNYALVVIINLTIGVQPTQYVDPQAILQAFTAFASSQCQTQSQPQISYSGQNFQIIYQYTQYTSAFFLALLVALNQSTLSNGLNVTVTMAGQTVVNATISTPSNEYAYFLFTVSLTFPGD